jgi:hypothetical protein
MFRPMVISYMSITKSVVKLAQYPLLNQPQPHLLHDRSLLLGHEPSPTDPMILDKVMEDPTDMPLESEVESDDGTMALEKRL